MLLKFAKPAGSAVNGKPLATPPVICACAESSRAAMSLIAGSRQRIGAGSCGGPSTLITIPAVSCAIQIVNSSSALMVFTMPRDVSFSGSVSAVDDGSDASSTFAVRTVR